MQKALIFVGGVALGAIGTYKLGQYLLIEILKGKKSHTWLMHRDDHYEKWRVYETTTPNGTTGGFYMVTDPDVKYEEKEATETNESESTEDSADNEQTTE